MQPIILLGIVAAGAIAMSSGFLAPEIANVWVQNLGVGNADLDTPVDHVAVDLDVGPTLVDPDEIPNNGDEFWKNAVNECSWHIGIDDLNTDGAMPETDIEEVICKITDIADNAIAECGMEYPETDAAEPDYPFSEHQECVPNEAYDGALELDNVHDVRVVVRGANPTQEPQGP